MIEEGMRRIEEENQAKYGKYYRPPVREPRIGFETMAKTISKRWKSLGNGPEMARYKELAQQDLQRYRREMDEYEKRLAERYRIEREVAAGRDRSQCAPSRQDQEPQQPKEQPQQPTEQPQAATHPPSQESSQYYQTSRVAEQVQHDLNQLLAILTRGQYSAPAAQNQVAPFSGSFGQSTSFMPPQELASSNLNTTNQSQGLSRANIQGQQQHLGNQTWSGGAIDFASFVSASANGTPLFMSQQVSGGGNGQGSVQLSADQRLLNALLQQRLVQTGSLHSTTSSEGSGSQSQGSDGHSLEIRAGFVSEGRSSSENRGSSSSDQHGSSSETRSTSDAPSSDQEST